MQEKLSKYMKNLETTIAAKEKIESELRIAHDIQMSMLPKNFPPFPGHEIDLYAVLYPARQVGGDLYDFFIHENTLFFAIGDACFASDGLYHQSATYAFLRQQFSVTDCLFVK